MQGTSKHSLVNVSSIDVELHCTGSTTSLKTKKHIEVI